MIRLIATDIDGTLIDTSKQISQRTIDALASARDAGIYVVPSSGRQPFSIGEVLGHTWVGRGIVVGANGAVGYDLGSGEVLFETLIDVKAQTTLFHALRERFPSIVCVSVRDAGATFWPEAGYVGMMDPGDHGREGQLPHYPLDEVLGAPSVKLVIRGVDVSPEALRDAAEDLAIPGVQASTSGAPFLEVAAEGVTKAAGLERLCRVLDVQREDVVAFGDNNNDVEMLQWAGWGVAMGNALPEVAALADETTSTNDEDGLAVVIERLAANDWCLEAATSRAACRA